MADAPARDALAAAPVSDAEPDEEEAPEVTVDELAVVEADEAEGASWLAAV